MYYVMNIFFETRSPLTRFTLTTPLSARAALTTDTANPYLVY